jgi:amino acid transporter
MCAGESKYPWTDVPVAMSFAYLVPLSLYPFILLSGAANVNYADPNLSKVWARGSGGISQSPYVMAAQTSALQGLPKALNLFFIISAYTAG